MPASCRRRKARCRAGVGYGLAWRAAFIVASACWWTTPSQAASAASVTQTWLVQLQVNGRSMFTAPVLQDATGAFWLAASDLARLRMKPDGERRRFNGREYVSLASMPVAFDAVSQTLTIDAPASAFETVTLELDAERMPRAVGEPAAFLNYDGYASTSSGMRSAGLLAEVGASSRWGVMTHSVFSQSGMSGASAKTVRLETTYSIDEPERLRTWRVGDAISHGGAWGRSVRYGGVQLATNFATQPYLSRLPLQSVNGAAVLPSTVDVFINNARVAQREVPAGPFAFTDLPIVTGSGEVRVVARDISGREQVFVQPFYVSPQLLRAGLNDLAFEAGAVRNNYALRDADYGLGFAAGTWRRGLSNDLTAELRGEAAATSRAGGASLAWRIPNASMVFLATLVGSESAHGTGTLTQWGVERAGALTWAARVERNDRAFAGLGRDPTMASAGERITLNGGYARPGLGSVGLGYVRDDRGANGRVELSSMSWSTSVGATAFATVTALRTRIVGTTTRTSVIAMLTIPFGSRGNTSVVRRHDGARAETNVQVQQSRFGAEGIGWTVQASDHGDGRAMVDAYHRAGTASLEATRFNGTNYVRAGATGSLVAFDGDVHASRRLESGFAVVSVPGHSRVGVLFDNQPVGQTDARGQLLVPGLRPYERNRLSIDPSDLPADVDVE
ncbi:MAG TPA: fimbria/pilus outer membrane usher protein, partial [Burkholderiaceae bacterium]|nr:fimbria/pilus outer membrane usher protein [Burkholderiaceae bacterium]